MTWIQNLIPGMTDLQADILFWFIATLFVYWVFSYGIPFITKFSGSEIDDVFIGILRLPSTMIVASWGLWEIIEVAGVSESTHELLTQAFWITITWLTSITIYLVIRDIIAVFIAERAEETETNIDDVVVRLVRTAGPIIVFVAATLITTGYINPDLLSTLLTVVGALGFLLAFLFQDPLTNLFSGIYLFVDQPFQIGDFLYVAGKSYIVQEIGGRYTRLYDTEDHTISFMPNSKLAEEKLVNVTRPSVELRQGINIGISYDTGKKQQGKDIDIAKVQEALAETAHGHEHVLGSWENGALDLRSKKELMAERIRTARENGDIDDADRLERERERLRIEYALRAQNQRIWDGMSILSATTADIEEKGLNDKEKKALSHYIYTILEEVNEIRFGLSLWVRWAGALQAIYKLGPGAYPKLSFADVESSMTTPKEWRRLNENTETDKDRVEWLRKNHKVPPIGLVDKEIELQCFAIDLFDEEYIFKTELKGVLAVKGKLNSLPSMPLRRTNRVIQTTDTFDDYILFVKRWSKAVRKLARKLTVVEKMLWKRGAAQYGVNQEIKDISKWFDGTFMLIVPGFRFPDADFVGFGESSLDFRLEFFVDDLMGEHYERLGDVQSEIGIAIKEKFDALSIEIPFPQRDVWFKNSFIQHNSQTKTG